LDIFGLSQNAEKNIMSNPVAPPTQQEIELVRKGIDRIFALQQSNRYKIANRNAKERIAKLKALLEVIYRRKQDIRDAHYADFKKPSAVTSEIKYAVRRLKKWMKPKKVRPTLATLTTSAHIRYEPKGMVLIISPWNFPFNLTFAPIVSAVAAGNCMMVKPSEFTPNTYQLMKEMAAEIFPEEEVAFLEGDKEVAGELLKKPFDHIFFTGSPEVGKLVMEAAAKNHSTVTLELGGKSPVIVDETAYIPDAAIKIAWGKFLNGGQACIAPDYLFVHESKYEQLIEALKRNVESYYGQTEENRQQSPNFARIISDRHHNRLADIISEAVDGGAEVETGGKSNPGERYISPTILSNISPEMSLMKEEIFGPVLPVLPFHDLKEVIKFINEREKPLAMYIFSRKKKNINQILSYTSAGGTCINDVMIHFLHYNLPFGGINNSGFGNSHGFYGFRAFSHERAVLRHNRFTPLKLLVPPYTNTVKKILELMVRYL
jgi:aldehyde dehydrogenase (NAD+)